MRPLNPPATARVLAPDLFLALLVAALQLIGSGVSLEDDFEISFSSTGMARWLPSPEGLFLLLAGCLPLVFRRVVPLSVFALTAAAALTYQAMGYGPEPLQLGVLVALYTVAVARRPVLGSATAAVYLVTLTLGALAGRVPITDDQYYTYLVSVVATVMLGYGVALGRAGASLAEQRAAAMARDQETRMQAAVKQEQARIAREVHDVVAHDVSVIVAQAGAARRVFASSPQTAVDALASIETVGRDALDGMRRVMTLLRTDREQDGRSPQPSLERLPILLTQVERAGLPVELTVHGHLRPVPATAELNAFRIVQEALTNILKHAGPTRATVVLEYGDDRLHIQVRDWGRGREDVPSTGYGMISMQQRAAMLGGELSAGPAEDRGFVVTAWLPLENPDRIPLEDPAAEETVGSAVNDSAAAPVEEGTR
jgi:signal transduction histidine kinase